MVLVLTFISMAYFELSFIWHEARLKFSFVVIFVFHKAAWFSRHHRLKIILLPWISLVTSSRITWPCKCGPMSGPPAPFHQPACRPQHWPHWRLYPWQLRHTRWSFPRRTQSLRAPSLHRVPVPTSRKTLCPSRPGGWSARGPYKVLACPDTEEERAGDSNLGGKARECGLDWAGWPRTLIQRREWPASLTPYRVRGQH